MGAVRQPMPSIDFINFEGLYTKQNPETLSVTQLRECKNADFFREYGSLSKLRGTRRILSSQYSESLVVKSIPWGAFYKTQDLSGAIDRQVLIGAGTTLQKIENDGTLTELLTGEPEDLPRTSDQFDRFLFITSADPFNVGRRGQMSKYDGTRITKWGLNAPGGIETVIEDFDDSSIFSTSNATVADSTDIAFKGTSTAMTKGTSSTASSMEDLNRSSFEINNVIEDRARMNVFIPRADFRKLATSGRAISVYIGSGSTLSTNYYRFDFQIGLLAEGWNTLIFDFSVFPSGDFGTTVGIPVDDDLKSIRFEVITNNASDTLTVYWDNFVSLDQGAPTPEFEPSSEQGSSTGVFPAGFTWEYRVTFVDDVGNESNSGPSSVTLDNDGATGFNQANLTDVPVSNNLAVIARNLYRTVADGSEFLFLGTINDNVTTTFTDSTPDLSLGTSTPPELGQPITDNSPPPSGGIMTVWKRTAFIAGDPLNPTILVFSRFDLPEAFPIANAIEFDERITGVFKTHVGLVVTTETSYWRIISDNPDYTVDKVIQGFGNVGARGVGTAREMGWATDRDGLRLYDLRETVKISEVIRDRVDAFNKDSLEESHTSHSRQHNGLFWFTKDSNSVYSDIYMYQYMIDDMRQGWFSQIIPNPATFNILHTWEIEDSNGDFHLYGSTNNGQVFELLAPDALNWEDETGKQRAITMEIQTPFIRAGATAEARELEGTSGRVTPRLIEFRVKEADGQAHEWTVTVETSDSASENASTRDSQDITFSFPAGVSLLRLPTQDLTPGEYVRLTLTNAQKDKDLQIMGLKLFYHTRPSQYTVTGEAGGGQN